MIKQGDFIELDFTAKLKETDKTFDTTLQDTAKKEDLPVDKERLKPIKICVGKGMVIKGLDLALENKEEGKEYSIDINPEHAFGKRIPSLVRTIPEKIFLEKDVHPVRGMMLNLDNMVARVISVSGGRVMVDFNNPLSGKVVTYHFKINRIIKDTKEKLAVLAENYLSKDSEIKLEDKKATITISSIFLKNKKTIENFVKMVKDMVGIEVKLEEKKAKEKKEEKTKEGKELEAKIKSDENLTKKEEISRNKEE